MHMRGFVSQVARWAQVRVFLVGYGGQHTGLNPVSPQLRAVDLTVLPDAVWETAWHPALQTCTPSAAPISGLASEGRNSRALFSELSAKLGVSHRAPVKVC